MLHSGQNDKNTLNYHSPCQCILPPLGSIKSHATIIQDLDLYASLVVHLEDECVNEEDRSYCIVLHTYAPVTILSRSAVQESRKLNSSLNAKK